MCGDCGCETAAKEYFPEAAPTTLHFAMDVLDKNNQIAHRNQHWFESNSVVALNLMSSPGAGKTALLERTIRDLKDELSVVTLVGDQQTDNDATRLQLAGGQVRQITTHSSCHLDASMIEQQLGPFVQQHHRLLFIENVGNLVCPSAFDLGEHIRVALLSPPEGEDKPVKYPVLFNRADLIIITKSDLIQHLDWSEQDCRDAIKRVNPQAKILKLSAKTGEGMQDWLDYLRGL